MMFTSPMPRRAAALVAAGAIALTLAACSGGGSGGSSSTQYKAATVPGASASANAAMNKLYKSALSSGKTKVVVYGPAPSTDAALNKVFEARFPGITVVAQDQADSTSLSKLQVEQKTGNRVADIFASGAPLVEQATAKPGACAAPTVATAPASEVGAQDSGRFIPYSLRYFTIAYNTSEVTKAEAPKSWADLLNPKWKGKIEMGDPTVLGGPRFAFADLLLPQNQSKWGKSYLTKLAAQNLGLASSEPQVPADVAAGKYEIGIAVYEGYEATVQQKGGNVALVFPMTDGGLFFTNTAYCRVNDAPDADAADLYINWTFTQEGQKALADHDNSYGTLPGSPGPDGAPTYDKLAKMPQPSPDLSQLSSEFATIDKLFKKSS